MAIFVAFAWVIEAAEWLGLIETECQKAHSRAYRLAHQGLALLKDELSGRPCEVVDDHTIRMLSEGENALLQSVDGIVLRRRNSDFESLLNLGPGGGASFVERNRQSLEVVISARTEDGGAYDVNLTLPTSRAGCRKS